MVSQIIGNYNIFQTGEQHMRFQIQIAGLFERGSPSQKVGNAECVSMAWRHRVGKQYICNQCWMGEPAALGITIIA